MKHLSWRFAIATLCFTSSVGAQTPVPPTRYELLINGESFIVELDRVTKLSSKDKPGQNYDVALRIAPVQQVMLGPVQLEYDHQAKVTRLGDKAQSGVRIVHELGYTMIATYLGEALEAKPAEEMFSVIVDSVKSTYKDLKVDKLEVGKPSERQFAGGLARGLSVRYRDAQDVAHTVMVCLLNGKTFAFSCVVDYTDSDANDVLPLVLKTLDSVKKP